MLHGWLKILSYVLSKTIYLVIKKNFFNPYNFRHSNVQSFVELPLIKEFNEYSNDEKCLLRNYIHSNINEDKLDIDLLLSLLVYILKNTNEGIKIS